MPWEFPDPLIIQDFQQGIEHHKIDHSLMGH